MDNDNFEDQLDEYKKTQLLKKIKKEKEEHEERLKIINDQLKDDLIEAMSNYERRSKNQSDKYFEKISRMVDDVFEKNKKKKKKNVKRKLIFDENSF